MQMTLVRYLKVILIACLLLLRHGDKLADKQSLRSSIKSNDFNSCEGLYCMLDDENRTKNWESGMCAG